jgi:hypothetical protein
MRAGVADFEADVRFVAIGFPFLGNICHGGAA